MLNRLIAAGVLLLALVGFGWWVQGLRTENAALTKANAELATDLEASETLRENEGKVAAKHTKTIARLRAAQRKTHDDLSAANAAESDWANTPVPAGVAAALSPGVRDEAATEPTPDPAVPVP